MAAEDSTGPWPEFLVAKGATLRQAVEGLETSQHLDTAALAAGQRRQLAQLLRSAARHVPWYEGAAWIRPLLAAIDSGSGEFQELWSAVPLLGKAELRDHATRLAARSLPAAQLPLGVTRTSGSVGIPVEVKTTALTRLAWDALTVREHLWRQRDFGKRLGIIRSLMRAQAVPGGSSQPDWGPPAGSLWRTGKASVIHIGFPLDEHIAWLRRFDPHYLLSYPSLVAALLDELGPGGRPPALEEVRMMSEPLDAGLEARLVNDWGVRVADVYSANEVGNIAFRCQENRLHVQSETILVEILDDAARACAPGEMGRVVLTSLHNLAMPLIRYDIGDFARFGEPCPCGRAHPVLDRVLGRVRNLALAPDGRRFWPSALARIREVPGIRQFQYVQTAPGTIELRLVLGRALDAADEARLRDLTCSLLGHPYEVLIRPVPAIPRGPTGKFEEFLSLLAAAGARPPGSADQDSAPV
ncbi:phenylacetate-CoA ligase [Gammaproteobacteria bacterium]|nr:phenylacetate-CoA ligase [Gammaproteobacteria bacterium]